MKTSLNKVEETEQYLNKQLRLEDQLLYEARLIVDEDLQAQTLWQQKTYAVIHAYGRMQLRNQLAGIHQRLMTEPQHRSFRKKILQYFSL